MLGKRGVEQPQVIVYVLLVTILTIAGLYVAFIYMGDVKLSISFSTYNTRFNAAAARFLNSPECFAVEETYNWNGQKYAQVHAGIISWEKFNESERISRNCINREKQIWLKLESLDGELSDTIWTGNEPSETELNDASKWQPRISKYLVLIQKADGSRRLGTLTMRLKE